MQQHITAPATVLHNESMRPVQHVAAAIHNQRSLCSCHRDP